MTKVKVNHPDRDKEFTTGAYSDAVIANGFLFISGQAAIDFKTSEFNLGTVEHETRLTLENIKAIVTAAGATMEDVVKSTVHLADIADFDKFNEVYASFFPGVRPARTTVQSVMAKNLKVEIDCIVALKK